MTAAELLRVLGWRKLVESDRCRIRLRQVENEPTVDVVPPVGELLMADGVVDQPCPIRTVRDAVRVDVHVRCVGAITVALYVCGLRDDGLAFGIPARVDGGILVLLVVVVGNCSRACRALDGPVN